MSLVASLVALLLSLLTSVENSALSARDLLAHTFAPHELTAVAPATAPAAPETNAATAATPLASQFITPQAASAATPLQSTTTTNSHNATLSQNVNDQQLLGNASQNHDTNSENVNSPEFKTSELEPAPNTNATPLALTAALAQEMAALITFVHTQANPASFPQQVAAGGVSYGGGGYVPGPSQNISQLEDTHITTPVIVDPSVNGGTLSGVTLSALSITTGTLTATSTVSLATTTIAGDLTTSGNATFAGTLTAGTLSVAGLSSGGAVAAPYFTATSTTATSSFTALAASGYTSLATTTIAGALTVNGNTNITQGGQLTVGDKIIAPGEIGLGTSTPAGKLAVQSTDASQTAFLLRGASGQTAPLIDIYSAADASLFQLSPSGALSLAGGISAASSTITGTTTTGGLFASFANLTSLIANALTATTASIQNLAAAAISGNTLTYSAGTLGTATVGTLTATSSLNVLGPAQFMSSANFFGSTAFGATGTTTISTAGTISTPGIVATAATATSLFAQTATIPSLTAGAVTATSSSATSTFLGYVNIGGGVSAGPSLVTITNTSGITPLEIHTANAMGIDMYSHANSAAFRAPALNLQRSRGTQASPLPVLSGDQLGYTQGFGYNGTGYVRAGFIQFNADENWNTSSNAGSIEFFTNASGSSDDPLERMRITSSGNIGIGTTSPWAKLSVNGNSDLGTSALAGFFTATNTAATTTLSGGLSVAGSSGLTVLQNGNVGIGTTNPANALSVLGNLNIGGSIGGTLDIQAADAIAIIKSSTGTNRARLRFNNSGGTTELGMDSSTGFGFFGTAVTPYSFVVRNQSNTPILFGHTSPELTILDGGNVGIGTTSPATKLEVYGGQLRVDHYSAASGLSDVEANSQLVLNSTVNNGIKLLAGISYPTYDAYLQGFNSQNNTARDIQLQPYGGNVGIGTTSPDSLLSISGGNTVAHIRGGGSSFVNIDSGSQSQYRGINLMYGSTYAWGIGQGTTEGTNGSLGFYPGSNLATGGTPSIVFSSSGNVGIGTTSPASLLSVAGNGYFTGNVGIGVANPTYALQIAGQEISIRNPTTPNITFTTPGVQDWSVGQQSSGNYFAINDGNNLLGANRLVINTSGNVGIGTTTPSYHLQVFDTGYQQIAATGSGGTSFFGHGAGGATIGTAQATPIFFRPNDTTRVTIDTSGNMGIGTTSPRTTLDVAGNVSIGQGTGGFGTPTQTLYGDNGTAYGQLGSINFIRNNYDPTGMAAAIRFYRYGAAADGQIRFATNAGTSTGQAALERVTIDQSGFFGIGTTTPTAQLSTTGTVRFSNFGAGTLTTDASGNLSVSSDERLKTINGTFNRGLDDLLGLSPIFYHWNAISGLDQTTQYAGFSAQNVQAHIPEAVGSSTSGYLTLQDRPLIAAIVNAIKEIATITGTFKTNLIAWLADSANGIRDFYASIIHGSEGHFADKVCVGTGTTETCVTQQQLAALLSQTGVATSPISVTASTAPTSTSPLTNSAATSTPDVTNTGAGLNSPATLTLNGNDPSTWPLNTPWQDNLGALFRHGGVSETIYATTTIDTSAAGTTTIDYWATWYPDPAATASAENLHATRIVTIQ